MITDRKSPRKFSTQLLCLSTVNVLSIANTLILPAGLDTIHHLYFKVQDKVMVTSPYNNFNTATTYVFNIPPLVVRIDIPNSSLGEDLLFVQSWTDIEGMMKQRLLYNHILTNEDSEIVRGQFLHHDGVSWLVPFKHLSQ